MPTTQNSRPTFFGGGGIFRWSNPETSGHDRANSVLIQPDGGILIGGTSAAGTSRFTVLRLTSNGSIDNSFGNNGAAVVSILDLNAPGSGNTHNILRELAIQADGKIIASGYIEQRSNNSKNDFALIRLTPNGKIDTDFGDNGRLTTGVGALADWGWSSALQSDEKIIIAGWSNNGTANDFSAVRITQSGTLDSSFDGDGKRLIDLGASDDYGHVVELQDDGKILIAGTKVSNIGNSIAVTRINQDGSLDTLFGVGGIAETSVRSGNGYGMAIQPDGKIVVVGNIFSNDIDSIDFSVVRFNSNGSLDLAFGNLGKVTTPVGTSSDWAHSVATQEDGKLVVAGNSLNNGKYMFSVVRYLENGAIDTSFGNDGKVLIDVGPGAQSNRMILQPDGKILITGSFSSGVYDEFAVVRLNHNGSLDITFDAKDTLGDSAPYTENSSPVALDTLVRIFDADLSALNAGAGNYAGSSITLARKGEANDDDVFSARGNVAFENGLVILSGVVVGALSNVGGKLEILFTANATQARIDEVLSSIAYSNRSDAPPSSISIEWLFTDGNTGEQGASGALTAIGNSTVNISPVEDEAMGMLTISGAVIEGGILTANLSAIDPDGEITSTTYHWRLNSGTPEIPSWIDIADITTSSMTLPDDQSIVGKQIRVLATTVDPLGGTTSFQSAPRAIANVDDEATGTLIIAGTAEEGGSLNAALSDISDADGTTTIAYRWQELVNSTWADLSGATAATLTIPANQSFVGNHVRVVATTTDTLGGTTTFESTAQTVANVNDSPTGTVTITGTPTQGQTLTASNSLADADGLGAITYTWKAGATALGTGTTYTLTQAEVGKTITVTASYTDGGNTAESVTSSATSAVANVNDAPTGLVTINGTAALGQTLTASNTLADPDGLGPITYTWSAGSSTLGTGATYTLTTAEVGKTVSVTASYTDGGNAAESVTSAATAAVVYVNRTPTGSVTITGAPTLGQTLTASNTLADGDGLGTITYTWKAGSSTIATGTVYQISQADVGKAITVTASYHDGLGNIERVTSAPTASIENSANSQLESSLSLIAPSLSYKQSLLLDPTFGSNGIHRIKIGTGSNTQPKIAITQDGEYLVSSSTGGDLFSVVAINPDGTPNSNFGSQGIANNRFSEIGQFDFTSDIAIQNDGKILVSGSTYINGTWYTALARLLSDGRLDPSFGTGGKVVDSPGNSTGIALQGDGKIVIAYTIGNQSIGIARYTDIGNVDPNFQRQSIKIGSQNSTNYSSDIALQADGKIVVAGGSYGSAGFQSVAIRLDSTGKLDNSFSSDGRDSVSAAGGWQYAQDLSVRADGAIYSAGANFMLVRYRTDGTLDSNFSGDGIDTISVGASYLSAYASLLQADGTMLVGGDNGKIVRFNPNGGKNLGFDFSDLTLDSIFDISKSQDGKIILVGKSGGDIVIYRYLSELAPPKIFATEDSISEIKRISDIAANLYSDGNSNPLQSIAITDFPHQQHLTWSYSLDGGNSWISAPSVSSTSALILPINASVRFIPNSNFAGEVAGLTFRAIDNSISIAASSNSSNSIVDITQKKYELAVSPQSITIQAKVYPENDPPTGSVIITGDAIAGHILTASHELSDPDELGLITYTWKADGMPISTGSAIKLTQSEVGKKITVTGSYTDGGNIVESATSAATAPVAEMANFSFDISVRSWNSVNPMPGINVSIGDQTKTTDATGLARFSSVYEPSISIAASVPSSSGAHNGATAAITLQDAVSILKMIAGQSLNGDGEPTLRAQSLAADFDGSGTVSLTDAIGVLRHAVGVHAPTPSWAFIDDDDDTVHSILNPGIPGPVAVEVTPPGPIEVNLIGVLRGDVDGSYGVYPV